MKRTLIIHGGTHKTGSSAIQTLLEVNRDALLTQGILFPVTGTMFHEGVGRRHFYVRETLFGTHARVKNLWTDLLAEIEQSGCHSAVLSYENFLSPGRLDTDSVRFLQQHFDIHFVCYLRDPVSYFNAKYKEWLRRLNFKGEGSDFVLAHFDYLDWQALLKPWIHHFGAAQVTCRHFDKLAFFQGRIEHDFLEYLKAILALDVSRMSIDLDGKVINPSFNNQQALSSLIRNRCFGGHDSLSYEQHVRYQQLLKHLQKDEDTGLILTEDSVRAINTHAGRGVDFVEKISGHSLHSTPVSDHQYDERFYCIDNRAQMKAELSQCLGIR